MRISDWSSDVCSSDLVVAVGPGAARAVEAVGLVGRQQRLRAVHRYVLFDQMFGGVAQRVPAAGRAGVGADCFLRAHAATSGAFSRSRRGCAYTTCPCSRAKPTRVSADDSASAIASAVGAEIAASTVIPACAAFIPIPYLARLFAPWTPPCRTSPAPTPHPPPPSPPLVA